VCVEIYFLYLPSERKEGGRKHGKEWKGESLGLSRGACMSCNNSDIATTDANVSRLCY